MIKVKKKYKSVSPIKGSILIAKRFIQDDIFSSSIVLVVNSEKGGHMGLALNKPVEMKKIEELSLYGFDNIELYCGGPVDMDRLFYIHNISGVSGAVKISKNLYVGGDLFEISDWLKMKRKDYKIKFFLGYCGWSSGQLDAEIKEESWVVSDLNVDVFTSHIDNLWKDSLLALKDNYFSMWLNFPVNPTFN